MKQIIKWFSSLALSASTVFAAELDWTFNFTPEDVSLTPAGAYTVVSLADGSNVRDAIGAPAIPAKFANILLPDGATDVSIDATGDLVLLASDIVPYPVQRVAPKSKPQPPFTVPDPAAYASASPWPAAVATYEGLHDMQGSTFVSVRVNPLVYVASEKALYYRPSVAVTVTYTAPASAPRSTRSVSQNALATEMVNALVVNPETADSPSAVRRRAAARASTVDYLIITSSTLSNAFQNLANYRATAAGGSYKTLVVTTNTIASSYSGDDIQMKIRNCISNYVKSSGTTYVVLGGDDSVVPDRDCYGNVDNETYEWHMPTDLYYSDLTGTWKASGNTNFGVVAASVDMSPDVIVGRIPVRTASQLSGYLAKVQAFEADTSHTRNSIIMGGPAAWCRYYGSKRPSDDVTGDGHAGFRASNRTGYVSDSEMWNRRLFRDGIKPYWKSTESSITMKIACDSITSWDSSTCGDKALSSSNLKTWLNAGYTHFMFSGHGYPQGWGMETSGNYSTTQASSQTGLVAFVYTDACLTGAFDEDGIKSSGITVDYGTSDQYTYTSEPCLGEAFVRNSSGGALVHMGCARYGWGTPDASNGTNAEDSDGYYTNYTATASSDGGPSTVYAYKFYKRLYESAAVSSNRTLGAAFAMSKADMISSCSDDGCERWIQFGLNYLGDPAIALYPRAVEDAKPEFSSSAVSLTGVTGETISFDFSSLLTSGYPEPSYNMSTSVSSYTFNPSTGALSFTPSAAGTYTFTGSAFNDLGTATCVLTVTVSPAPPETPSEVAVVSSDSFTATWSPVTGATTYELLVIEGASGGGGSGSGPFTLVTSSSGLTAGEYVILADGIDRAMNNNCNGDSSGVLSYEDVTVDNSTITTDEASIIWTLAGNADSCTLFNAAAGKYVNPATARNVGWSANASGAWTLSLNNGVVTVANAANTSWMLQYNSGSPRFALYDNNNQKKLRFFRRDAGRSLPRAVGDVVYSNSVGNVTSFSVTGLQPDTSYSYSVRAIVNGDPTPWSDSVSVTTTEGDSAPSISVEQTSYAVTVGDPDVDFMVTVTGSPTPTVTHSCTEGAYYVFEDSEFVFEANTVGTYHFVFTATNTEGSDTVTVTVTVSAAPVTVPTLLVDDETDTTAYATWDACTGVTSYTLQLASDNQFTTGGSGSAVLEADFSDTSDWTLSGTGTYVNSPLYGAGSPALAFKNTGHYAISPEFSGGTTLSFWAYGNNGSGSTFAISRLVNGSWTEIETVSIDQGGKTYEVALPSGTTQLRFDFTKNGYNCALDDVVVTGASGSGSLIAEYTVNDTEYTFTGLTPFTVYYARVKGNADWSNVAEFITDVAGDSAPVWSTLPTPSVTVGSAYSFTPAEYVSGTPAPTITLSSTTASSGYTFANGTLSFTPAATGSFDFTFTANNGIGSPASATLTVVSTGTAPAVSVPQTSCSTSLGGADVEFTVTATGTPTPTLALSDTTATSGYDFDPDDGFFTFTPYATGDFTFTFTATSLLGSDSVTVTVTVSAAAVTVPTLAVTNITATNALASWTACDGVSSYTLQLATNEFSAGAATITDTLTAAKLSLGGSYGAGSYASDDSGAEYAAYGMTKSGGTAIQIRSNDSQSGIVVTKSAGSVTEVRVTFESSTASNRTLNIYGAASAYSSAADLYSASTAGELLGTIVYDGSNATGSYTINGSYAFIGIRSASGAIYLDNVEIDWTPASGTTSKGLVKDGGDGIQTFTVNDTSYEFTGLTPETTYYARVKGTSDWSNVETFTTLAGADSAPVWSAIPAQNYLFGSNNGTFEFNVAPYASGSPAPAFYLDDTPWTAYVDDGTGDFIFEPDALGTFDFTVIASNTLGTANATLSVVVTAAPPAFVGLPATTNGYAGEDVTFTVVATGNPAPVLDVDAADGLLFDFNPTTGLFEFNSDNTGDFEFEFTAANIAATVTQTVTVTISPAPVTVPVLTVSEITTTTALASWTACDGVSTYTLQLTTNDFPAASGASRSLTTLLHETFAQASGTATITSFDSKADNPGWEGSYVLAHNGAVRLSSGSGSGELVSPWLTNTTAGASVRVVFSSLTWTNDYTSAVIDITEDGENFTDSNSFELGASMQAYTNTFTVTGTRFRIRWTPSANKKRFFLDDITITTPSSGGGDDPGGDSVQTFTVTGTSYTFTNLTPDTAYLARVKGNAGWSEEVIFQTLGTAATAPSIAAIADQTYTYGDNDGEFTLTVTASGTPAPTLSVTSDDAIGLFDIDAAGEFIFLPTAVGTFHFTVTATNGVSPDATASFAVTVTGTAPTLAAIADQTVAVEEEDLTISLTVTGNPAPTVSVASSDAPEGMFEINSDGDFYFVFDETGTFHFTITAANGVSPDATQSFTVTVTGAPEPLTDYQQWLQAHGIATDTSADAQAPNGHTYGQNYAADIDPSSTQWLEITVTTTNFTFAPSSTNRYYQLLYTTDLSTGIYQTNNLGQGATSGSFPEVEGDWYGGLRVTPEAP